MKYTVTFVQYYTYKIEADDEDEAFDEAYDEFTSDMRRPIARIWYDDIEVECEDEDKND